MDPTRPDPIARVIGQRTTRRSALRGFGGGSLAVATLGIVGRGPVSPSSIGASPATLPFAFRLETSEPVRFDGGLARIASQREFPVLTGMAIRSESIDPGALQTPHWHPNAGEVHYVISGQGSAGVVSPGGEHAVFDLRPGSVSFFPMGHYHYVHSTGAEPLRVLAAYTHENPIDVGSGEVVGFVPKSILAQVLGVAATDLPDLPAPASRPVVPLEAAGAAPPVDPDAPPIDPYTLNLDDLEPVAYEGGTVTNVRGKELARLKGISFLPLSVEAGGVREPHWHPNAAELIYLRSGEAEIGLVTVEGEFAQFTIGPGDLAFFPANLFHYVASTGAEPLDSIVWLSHEAPQRIDLSDAVAYLPRSVTAAAVGLDASALDALPDRPGVVVAASSGS